MRRLFTMLFITAAAISSANAQDTLVGWTCPTGTATDSTANIAKPVNATSVLRSTGTSAIDFSTNGVGGIPGCAQATGWDNGANAKYWEINFKSTGYMNLTLSSAQRAGGANPGPRDFKVQYKITSGGTWTDVAGIDINAATGNWSGGAVTDFALPAALNNLTDMIYVRWIMTTDSATNGNPVGSAGISKIDDIVIKAVPDLTGIDHISAATAIDIFPNPSSGDFTIKSEFTVAKLSISDMQGRLVYQSAEEFTHKVFFAALLKPGLYFIRCETKDGNKTVTKKLVID